LGQNISLASFSGTEDEQMEGKEQKTRKHQETKHKQMTKFVLQDLPIDPKELCQE
jgi:hypothetical protein